MKNKYDLIVKKDNSGIDSRNENIRYFFAAIFSSISGILTFIFGSYPPFAFFSALTLFSLFVLYINHAVYIKVKDDKIYLRRLFFYHKYDLEDFERYYTIETSRIVYVFKGKCFSYPGDYLNIKDLTRLLLRSRNPLNDEALIDALCQRLKKNTARSTYNLEPDLDSTFDLFSSKIGDYPYWDLKKEFPKDSDGKNMSLLCQINFEENPFNNGELPEKGILQFYIAKSNDLYGVDLKNPDSQKNFRVVYHNEIDRNVTLEQIKKLTTAIQEEGNLSPVIKPCKLIFSQTVSCAPFYCYTKKPYQKILSDFSEEFFGKAFDGDLDDLLGENNYYQDKVEALLQGYENHMLGYPDFIQGDPREDFTEDTENYYDTLLLCLDSTSAEGNIMSWGDGGIANFLINSEALKKLDFSKVFYSWDCF